MSLVEPSPLKPGDDLDGLLRTFFRSQMPQPWPVPPMPRSRSVPATRPAASRHPLMRSRFALAASVALLLFGSLFLPGRFAPNLTSGTAPDGTPISNDDLRHQMRKELKSKQSENKNHSGLSVDDGDEFDLSPIK
jgi:hypothetical protein